MREKEPLACSASSHASLLFLSEEARSGHISTVTKCFPLAPQLCHALHGIMVLQYSDSWDAQGRGEDMKKLIVLSLIVAGIVLMAGFSTPAQVQSPGVDAKPTFISPTPGLYVNGWPPFTVSYPKDWEELPPKPMAVFEAAGTRLGLYPSPVLAIMVLATPLPIEDWAKISSLLGQPSSRTSRSSPTNRPS